MASFSNPDLENSISAIAAGKQFGYTNDYITRLAREKKILARQVGRQWYVDTTSLENFVAHTEASKKAYAEKIRLERKQERVEIPVRPMPHLHHRATTLAKAGFVLSAGFVIGAFFFTESDLFMPEGNLSGASVVTALKTLASHLIPGGNGAQVLSAVPGETPRTTHAPDTEALVVVPPGTHTSNAEIAQSFSDQVTVTKDRDGESGVITPSFKNATATPYRFVLVPMHPP